MVQVVAQKAEVEAALGQDTDPSQHGDREEDFDDHLDRLGHREAVLEAISIQKVSSVLTVSDLAHVAEVEAGHGLFGRMGWEDEVED